MPTRTKRRIDSHDETGRAKRLKVGTEIRAMSVTDNDTNAGQNADSEGVPVDEHVEICPAYEGRKAEASGRNTDKRNDKEIAPLQVEQGGADIQTASTKPKHKVRKLAPPRPFPTVPTSVSASGPRSAHTEGKNCICITRKTQLGAYLRRCKDVFLKDGYKTLHLSAMGAAIPHLMQLTLSLPPILPFSPDEVHTEILTGTVEVQDEVIPEDEDEDIGYRTRGKSTVSVVIQVGDGIDEVMKRGEGKEKGKGGNKPGKGGMKARNKNKDKDGRPERVIIREVGSRDV
ncbi:hypothetical protein AcW1_005335 [Taiwanofungus camphoratus]|nr:hypothetical protein AcV5_005650 [Antrodia cinnamomea]KAI0956723.1 hypothetical protein AcW1_005335 [Antrodia cinnamomea]